ncbi:DMT family transporter [Actinokineospora sp.]|uniref:DMT family transporter n=1 Tax=Actinokineospora sp. TaxID=1872133 RepID=UPI0040379F67
MSESVATSQSVAPARAAAPAGSSRAWTHLLVASAFEIVFALGTNGSDGFTHLWWSVVAVVGGVAGVYFLSLAMRSIDIAVGYTVWTGIGSVGTVLFGAWIFDEPLSPLKALCFLFIIAGVVGLRLTAKPSG